MCEPFGTRVVGGIMMPSPAKSWASARLRILYKNIGTLEFCVILIDPCGDIYIGTMKGEDLDNKKI
jgi:hypothetical protein